MIVSNEIKKKDRKKEILQINSNKANRFHVQIRLQSALLPRTYNVHQQTNAVIIMETIFVYLNVQL